MSTIFASNAVISDAQPEAKNNSKTVYENKTNQSQKGCSG